MGKEWVSGRGNSKGAESMEVHREGKGKEAEKHRGVIGYVRGKDRVNNGWAWQRKG